LQTVHGTCLPAYSTFVCHPLLCANQSTRVCTSQLCQTFNLRYSPLRRRSNMSAWHVDNKINKKTIQYNNNNNNNHNNNNCYYYYYYSIISYVATEELLHCKGHRSNVHVSQGIIMLIVSWPCSDCACSGTRSSLMHISCYWLAQASMHADTNLIILDKGSRCHLQKQCLQQVLHQHLSDI